MPNSSKQAAPVQRDVPDAPSGADDASRSEFGRRAEPTSTPVTTRSTAQVVADFIRFLETGAAANLFSADAFCDFTMPLWRLQARGRDDVIGLRRHGHPTPGTVPRSRWDPTPTGFVLELEETWTDANGDWYCREMFRADIVDGTITELSVYCTGDWDVARRAEHAAAVTLLRP